MPSLDQLLTQKLAEKLGVSEAEVEERTGQCPCQWPADFRAKVETAIREAGGDPDLLISPPCKV